MCVCVYKYTPSESVTWQLGSRYAPAHIHIPIIYRIVDLLVEKHMGRKIPVYRAFSDVIFKDLCPLIEHAVTICSSNGICQHSNHRT